MIAFIPHPVIVRFTAGIGVTIFVGQRKDCSASPARPGWRFHEKP